MVLDLCYIWEASINCTVGGFVAQGLAYFPCAQENVALNSSQTASPNVSVIEMVSEGK